MFRVDSIKCTGCGHCVDVCPQRAITTDSDVAVINQELCVDCGICAATCPSCAIYELVPVYAEQWKGGNDMPYGYGGGFGFRGASPPWPYVGRGRGGLPRCGYPSLWGRASYVASTPYGPAPTGEEELGFLKDQAGVMKRQLGDIKRRIQELEKKE